MSWRRITFSVTSPGGVGPLLEMAKVVQLTSGLGRARAPRVARSQSAHSVALGAVSRSRIHRALIGHKAERVLDASAHRARYVL